jgi:hypothetical protein
MRGQNGRFVKEKKEEGFESLIGSPIKCRFFIFIFACCCLCCCVLVPWSLILIRMNTLQRVEDFLDSNVKCINKETAEKKEKNGATGANKLIKIIKNYIQVLLK